MTAEIHNTGGISDNSQLHITATHHSYTSQLHITATHHSYTSQPACHCGGHVTVLCVCWDSVMRTMMIPQCNWHGWIRSLHRSTFKMWKHQGTTDLAPDISHITCHYHEKPIWVSATMDHTFKSWSYQWIPSSTSCRQALGSWDAEEVLF